MATTVGAVMATTAADGWAVAYRGSMVAEEYLDGFGAQTRHLLFSVSKSLVAAVVGALHGAGVIELDAPVTAYVPALANCGYAGATVRHLLDMRSSIAFSENYLDPIAEIHVLDQAIGWAPKSGPDVPSTLRDFLLTLRQKSAHGGLFEYRSCETDVLGWICEVAGGQRALSGCEPGRCGGAGSTVVTAAGASYKGFRFPDLLTFPWVRSWPSRRPSVARMRRAGL